jgi:hypothetical protein
MSIQLHMAHAEGAALFIFDRIKREHFAAKPNENLRDHRSNFPSADDTGGFAVNIEAEQSVEREVSFAHAIVSAMQFAVQRKHQTDCVLSHCVARITRHAHNGEAAFRRRVKIDIVVSGAARSAGFLTMPVSQLQRHQRDR